MGILRGEIGNSDRLGNLDAGKVNVSQEHLFPTFSLGRDPWQGLTIRMLPVEGKGSG